MTNAELIAILLKLDLDQEVELSDGGATFVIDEVTADGTIYFTKWSHNGHA